MWPNWTRAALSTLKLHSERYDIVCELDNRLARLGQCLRDAGLAAESHRRGRAEMCQALIASGELNDPG